MGPAYEVQVVLCQEFCDAVWAKGVANTSIILAPALQQHMKQLICWHSTSTWFPAKPAFQQVGLAYHSAVLAWICLSGSAHSRSHSSPVSGTSVGRGIRLICSSDLSSGDRPPCMHRICGRSQASLSVHCT